MLRFVEDRALFRFTTTLSLYSTNLNSSSN